MTTPETVYDSTDLQLESLRVIVSGELTLNDLAKPGMVQLILERHRISLTDLKSVKGELVELRHEVTRLNEEREELRIDLATSKQRQSILWLEIPLSFLSAFAINMLTASPVNSLGWPLLAVSLIMLLFLRLPELWATFRRGKKNGQQKD